MTVTLSCLGDYSSSVITHKNLYMINPYHMDTEPMRVSSLLEFQKIPFPE